MARKAKRIPLGRILENAHARPSDRSLEDAEDWELTKQLVARLPPRMQLIVVARHNGRTFAQIGLACGVTPSRIYQIHKHAIRILAAAAKAQGRV